MYTGGNLSLHVTKSTPLNPASLKLIADFPLSYNVKWCIVARQARRFPLNLFQCRKEWDVENLISVSLIHNPPTRRYPRREENG